MAGYQQYWAKPKPPQNISSIDKFCTKMAALLVWEQEAEEAPALDLVLSFLVERPPGAKNDGGVDDIRHHPRPGKRPTTLLLEADLENSVRGLRRQLIFEVPGAVLQHVLWCGLCPHVEISHGAARLCPLNDTHGPELDFRCADGRLNWPERRPFYKLIQASVFYLPSHTAECHSAI